MAHDKRPAVPPQTSESAASADVGGIPAPLSQGVDHASDRASARRDGSLESDAGGIPPSLPVSQESAAVSPRAAHDKTQSARPSSGADATSPATSVTSGTASDAGSRHDGTTDQSGQDDSPLESIGKAITEPFKSD
jgi:hypothetical protein